MIESPTLIQSRSVALHYDDLDHFYRQIWGEHLHHGLWTEGNESVETAVRQLSHLVAKCAHVSAGQTVGDIGCGYGATSQLLADEYGANVIGVTISSAQYEIANQRSSARGQLRFRLMDWLENDFEDESFDSLIAIESTEHMIDKERVFREAFRVLKKGGHFVICAWCSSEIPSSWQRKFLLEPICAEGRLPQLLSPGEYLNLGRLVGFKQNESDDLSKHVARTWLATLTRTVRHFATHPTDLVDLASGRVGSSDFTASLARIALAYKLGAMNYALLRFTKPT